MKRLEGFFLSTLLGMMIGILIVVIVGAAVYSFGMAFGFDPTGPWMVRVAGSIVFGGILGGAIGGLRG